MSIFIEKRTMCKICLYGILEKRHSLYKNGGNIMRKRFLSILFALCIMLCLVPVTVFAEENAGENLVQMTALFIIAGMLFPYDGR